jgi:multidrug resistance protein, MATE family
MDFIWKHFRGFMHKGESFKEIFRLWTPEVIAQTIFISLPPLVDSYLVASLQSTTIYGALGMANHFIHLLMKFSEAIPVAAIAIIGRYNGAKEYDKCGRGLGDTFWTTLLIGFAQFMIVFSGASTIYRWLNVPDDMLVYGVPFLRMRSIGLLLVFVSLAFIAFMKAVKNTKAPMVISVFGLGAFFFFDYALILGKFGFPKMGLMGSAIASIVQYSIVVGLAFWYVVTKDEYRKYFSKFFIRYFSTKRVLRILNLSWPVVIDKGSLAFAYVWLAKMTATMGEGAIASMDVVKNLERFAMLPAIALAQIIILLVSNRLGAKDEDGARANIKKVMILASIMVSLALVVLCIKSRYFVGLFDPNNVFTDMVVTGLPFISILVVFDFVQLILAGALRGAGDVRTVMMIRFLSCFGFLIPVSYLFAHMNIESVALKFTLVYSCFYFNTGIMGLIFLWRILGRAWQRVEV